MDKFQFYFELITFVSLIGVCLYLTIKGESKWNNIAWVSFLITLCVFSKWAKAVSSILFIVGFLFIILFDIKWAKRHERRIKRLGN